MYSLIHSFVDSLIHSFVRSFVRSIDRSIDRSIVRLFVRSFVRPYYHRQTPSLSLFLSLLTHNQSLNRLLSPAREGLDYHNNPRDDLWVLDLTTLAWTEVRCIGIPPPAGLGGSCLTQTGRDIVVTRDKVRR